MSDHRQGHPGNQHSDDLKNTRPSPVGGKNVPIELIDQLLASIPPEDPRQRILYRLRQAILQGELTLQQSETEIKKLEQVVAKVTAPANRIGTLLSLPAPGLAQIIVGGAEYYTQVDPRLSQEELKTGTRVLVNEAYAVIKTMGYEQGGPVVKIADCMADGRIRVGSEQGLQGAVLQRSSDLVNQDLEVGDTIRMDPNHRVALERLESPGSHQHLLEEIPQISWDQIGGQQEAIQTIRRAIEYPLVHPEVFKRFRYQPPKGFLLYGPPGCGKTLIGKATACSLVQQLAERGEKDIRQSFLHVKGPEILNMWLGESERMVRELFAQAKAKRKSGFLPFIFIDEAESILGTRRSMRSLNISNTLVPMFCTEMDGMESLREVVIILATNRPDLIDPSILRPGRIDRKIKVKRPNREESGEILQIYLTEDIPLDPALLERHNMQTDSPRQEFIRQSLDLLFNRTEEARVISIQLRSGQREILYRGDLVTGAIIASVIQRAKEKAIERTIRKKETSGLALEDVQQAIDSEYREGEILPPDDAVQEWMKLLDRDPYQVVGLSSFRNGRGTPKKLPRTII